MLAFKRAHGWIATLALMTAGLWACSEQGVLEPPQSGSEIADAKGGNGKGKGGGGGGGDDGGGSDPAFPIVQGAILPGTFVGDDPSLFQAVNGLITGKDDECGFVYDIETESKTCLEIPGADPALSLWPDGLNASGRIAGSTGNGEIAFVVDYPDLSSVTELPLPDGWSTVFTRPFGVNAAGQIVGQLQRPHPNPPPKDPFLKQYALILWNADLEIASVSATLEELPLPGGLSDAGIAAVSNLDDPAFWDGTSGALPTPLDDGGSRWSVVDGITADGLIYGRNRGATIVWADVDASPSEVVDLDLRNITWHDRYGNLLGFGTSSGGPYCIEPTTGSVTELAPVVGYDRAVARDGADGVIYGFSALAGSKVLTMWEVPGGVC